MKTRLLFLVLLLFSLTALAQDFPEVTAKIFLQPETIKAGEEAHVVVEFSIPKGYHMYKQPEYLYLDIDENPAIITRPTIYPEGIDEKGNVAYYGTVQIKKPFTAKKEGDLKIIAFAGWQMCDDAGTCFAPNEKEKAFLIKVEKNENIKQVDKGSFKGILNYLVYGDQTNKRPLAEVLKFLLFAFLGGVILNVMPCVLPVLSIKAMHIVGQAHQDKKEIFASSMFYTLGILVSFFVMATVVSIIKIMGEGVGWGFQFQNVGFSLSLAALLFVFALSLFDVFVINPPGMNMATKAGSKKGHSGSFFSGIFAVLLATPCTAPLLAPALGVAFSMPPLIILVFFIAIGVGLALPFILLAFWPKVIQALPKPGNWMNTFKEIMGFLLFGTTIFLLHTIYILVDGGTNFLRVIWFFLILAIAAWVYGTFGKPHFSKRKQWLALIIAIAMIVGGAYFILDFKEQNQGQNGNAFLHEGWEKFDPAKVQELVDSNVPVFVGFGAKWCMTCNTNEKVVLYTDQITKAFKDKGVVLFKGDNTKKDPVIGEWLKKYDRAGVPLYLLFRPNEGKAHVFPEILTPAMVIDELNKIK